MKRDQRAVIAALLRKANDRACTPEERDALLAKAKELHAKHAPAPEPEPQPVSNVFRVRNGFGNDGYWFNGGVFTVTGTTSGVVRMPNGQTINITFSSGTHA